MKKIFFSLLAIAALASCAKTEAVYEGADSEIKLVPVAAKQTKANVLGAIDGTEYPTAENFDVYGYWKNVGAGETYTDGQSYFGGAVEFTNKGNYWGGVTPYYWPKNGALRFAAYSPADLDLAHEQVGDVFSVDGYSQPSNTAETWDFLVAPTSESYTAMTAAENVSVVFEHALSWITLQVKTKDAAAEGVFTIKSVKINGVNTTADFEASMLGQEMVQYESWTNWSAPAEYVVFDGVQGVTAEPTVIENTAAGTLVIPQATTNVTVVFDQKGVNGTMDMTDMVVNLDLVLDQDNEPWRPGYHYIYTLVFGLDEILINPSVDLWNEYIVGELDPEAINVSTAAQLEAALANENATKIVFQNDIAGQFNVPEAAKTLTIDGNGYKFDGTFNIVGNSSYTQGNTIFENINFETADASALTEAAFICCNAQKGNTRYPDNVTINNCTFTATGAAEKAAVGAKFRSLEGTVAIQGTKATGMHSLLQMLSSGEAEVAISNVTIENGKNGISLQYTGGTISETTINADEYGIRADGSKTTLNIVKSNIEAKQPVVVRNVTVDGYVLNLDETTLTTSEDYQVIFTKGADDAAYEVPSGAFTFNGPETTTVYPGVVSMITTVEELQAALDAATEDVALVFGADLVGDVTVTQAAGVKIILDGNGKKFDGMITVDGKSATYTTAGLTIRNLTFNASSISGDACIRLGDGTNATRYTCNVAVENCTFAVPGAVGVKSYTGGDKNLTISGCTATADAHSLLQAKGIDGILVKKCTINSKNGLNFNNSTNVLVDECNADVRGYAARFGEGSNTNGAAETYEIKNSTLKSACEDGDAVIILRGTADESTLTLTNTTLEGTTEIKNNAVNAKVIK